MGLTCLARLVGFSPRGPKSRFKGGMLGKLVSWTDSKLTMLNNASYGHMVEHTHGFVHMVFHAM